jgi:hypothetical protein
MTSTLFVGSNQQQYTFIVWRFGWVWEWKLSKCYFCSSFLSVRPSKCLISNTSNRVMRSSHQSRKLYPIQTLKMFILHICTAFVFLILLDNSNALYSSCNSTVHLLWRIYQGTYFNLYPYQMQHSTLALNKVNLTAVQKFAAVTPHFQFEYIKPLFAFKTAYLKYCALCNIFL